jgi:hypothetical protein
MSDSDKYLTLDKNIVKSCKNVKEFCLGLSKKDISALSQRVKRFSEEKETRRNALASTGEEIAKLWSLLRVPSAEREFFQNSFKKNLSMETVNKGYMEVTRLQELRKTSLAKVIANIRSDILALWEEAGIENDSQRAEEFPQYFLSEEQLDEIVLDLHEVYYNQIRVRVEELRPLLKIISRRETVIQERIELEHLQLNPERLTARGPNAREERKREEAMTNRVKNLEKLSKEVLHHISTWEESNGPFFYGVRIFFFPFYYYSLNMLYAAQGERYSDRINRQEEEYISIRDSLRNARKRKDGKQPAVNATGMLNTTTLGGLNNANNNDGLLSSTTGNSKLLAT